MDNEQLREKRIFSGETEGDNRTQFQRDRDRILYTPAFRRLAGVAQVVHVNTERGYHNRLTHSLKVAQVGRRLAEHLEDVTNEPTIADAGGLDADVVETACLAHDLGHPPFGHAAEDALQHQLDNEHSVFDSFEGNPQSFRIVNRVAIHKTAYGPEYSGLDLTLATLNAILKYPWSREPSGKENKKWGYYNTETELFEDVRQLKTPGDSNQSMSLEAKVMDWADDLTYAIHDVVDFYRAGLIPLGELLRNTNEREKFAAEFESDDDHSDIPSTWDATGFLEDSIRKLGEVAGNTGGNPLESPFNGSSDDRATLGFLSSELIERYLGLNADTDVEIDPDVNGGLRIDDELEYEVKLLKYLTEYYVFKNPALVAQQHGHKRVVNELFEILFEATASDADNSEILPQPFDEQIALIHQGEHGYVDVDPDTLRARVVADIIASMTEKQALEMFERVTGQSPGLVTDRIVTNW